MADALAERRSPHWSKVLAFAELMDRQMVARQGSWARARPDELRRVLRDLSDTLLDDIGRPGRSQRLDEIAEGCAEIAGVALVILEVCRARAAAATSGRA